MSHTELGRRGFAPQVPQYTPCRLHWPPCGSRAGLTLAFSSRNSGWSGVVWARHCSTSGRNRNCTERPTQSFTASRRGAHLTLPGTGPLPSWPGHCLPGELAPAQRPAQFFSQQPDSQQSWRLVQPLENGRILNKLMTSTDIQ